MPAANKEDPGLVNSEPEAIDSVVVRPKMEASVPPQITPRWSSGTLPGGRGVHSQWRGRGGEGEPVNGGQGMAVTAGVARRRRPSVKPSLQLRAFLSLIL